MNDHEAAAIALLVDERARELIRYIRWIKRLSAGRQLIWRDLRVEYMRELHSLLVIRRKARKSARVLEQRDALTSAKSYHDWQIAGPVR